MSGSRCGRTKVIDVAVRGPPNVPLLSCGRIQKRETATGKDERARGTSPRATGRTAQVTTRRGRLLQQLVGRRRRCVRPLLRGSEAVRAAGMLVDDEFEVQNGNPKFLCRDGAAAERGESYSQKKLCFTSTRRELLAQHLLELSRRDDCYFVKFGVNPRGGMFLGRCFLATDEAVGEVWAEYKSHPALFCTVQDDDFVGRFRELSFACDD